ncbi:MAG: hypothetical protein NZO16_06100 [Deltaproteobacteria bacterium]|nr:hypothetical protein [Deltaproteobacteria bacterium]
MRWVLLLVYGCLVSESPVIEVSSFVGNSSNFYRDEFLPQAEVWNHSDALSTESENSKILIKFIAPQEFRYLIIQADSNDSYIVECLDRNSDKVLWVVPKAEGRDGLSIRKTELARSAKCQIIQIRPGVGDSKYSVARFKIFLEKPENWRFYEDITPKLISYVGAPQISVERMFAIRLGVLFLGLLILTLPPTWFKNFALTILLVLGLLSWFNIGRFHLTRYFHAHDVFHYYVGSKYSPELGYKLIYRCLLQALDELNIPRPGITRDLESNAMVSSDIEFQKGSTCREKFTEARWKNFVHDIRYFSKWLGNFGGVLGDHGYNASPVWNIFGYVISNLFFASDFNLSLISFFDFFLLSIGMLLALKAFGFACIVVFVTFWGTNAFADYGWIGNSYMRMDWFAWTLIGVSLLKLNYQSLGLIALSIASLLRIFPGLALLGLFVWALKNKPSFIGKIFLCFGGVFIFFMCVEIAIFSGFDHVQEFFQNLKKHSQTYSTNVVGIKIIASYSDQSRALSAKDPLATDVFVLWKQKRNEVLNENRLLYFGLIGILSILFMGLILKPVHLYTVPIVSLLLVQIISASNYDYVFLALLAFAPLGYFGQHLCLVFSGLSHFVYQYYFNYPYDDIYFGMSVLVYCWSVICFGVLLITKEQVSVGRLQLLKKNL